MGRAEGVEQKEPVAWTNKPTTGNRVFFTTLGHEGDFEKPEFRIMLLNAVHWALKREPPGKLKKPASKKESRLPQLKTPDDLEVELVLREPEIANPLYLHFDERDRLWVVEYRQYPWPAGLRMVSHDKVYRNVYDPAYLTPIPLDKRLTTSLHQSPRSLPLKFAQGSKPVPYLLNKISRRLGK